jgi:predicted O-linked N-acetylglucosamine transferase (SPINDLY family)
MAELSLREALQKAVGHQQAGRLRDAEALYRRILDKSPNDADALHYLGVVAAQQGRSDLAVDLIKRALAQRPHYPEARYNLAEALRTLGELDKAIAAYRQAIAQRPDYLEARNNLGLALAFSGQLDEAASVLRQTIALNPTYAEAHCNLGVTLTKLGQLDESIAEYRQAIALNPKYAKAHHNMGEAFRARADFDQAVAAYRQSIAINPKYAEAHNHLGVALGEKGAFREAVDAFQQAIALRPKYAEAHSNLGAALRECGHLDDAAAACQKAIELKPDHPEAFNNLGNVYRDNRQHDEAIAALRQAISLNPDFVQALDNLGQALKDAGQLDESIALHRRALAIKPDWAVTRSNLLLVMHYHPDVSPAALAEEHRHWNRQHAEPLKKLVVPHNNDRDPDRRLRIGYVSADFRSHPVGRFMAPLLENHDKSRVEVFGYFNHAAPDATTDQLRSAADVWRDIAGFSDEQVAKQVRDDRIDILVDLSLHTGGNRLLVFARKPAPVQVSYLGYCSTTGLDTIDYRLSDPYFDPPDQDESVYSERTIRLPETYWCYRPGIDVPVGPAPALASGQVTFGSLNNFCKISGPALTAWAGILRAVPRSHLIVHAHQGRHRQELLQRLEGDGIDAGRVRFVCELPIERYFQQYHEIDICLDTFPYAGGTTTCDAAWMGVPTVSVRGRTAVGRGSFSVMSNIGAEELVARTPEEYVNLAVDLANDLPRLGAFRSTLRPRMEASPLMNGPRFAANVEAAYRRMWHDWCASR